MPFRSWVISRDRTSSLHTFSLEYSHKPYPSYVWPSTWGPTYRKSYGITLSNFALGIVMTFIFSLHLKHLNKRLDRGELINGIQGVEVDEETVRDAAQLEGITIEEALKRRKGFRYLY
jgi:hypothetical protein